MPVTELLVQRLPVTLELSAAALMLAVLIGVPLGVISGYRHNSAVDVATMFGANVGVSMPVFWLGLMLQNLFAVKLRDTPLELPPSGRLDAGHDPRAVLREVGMEQERRLRVHLQHGHGQRHLDLERRGVRQLGDPPDPAGVGAVDDPDGDHRPHDPCQPARRARTRLRPHRPSRRDSANDSSWSATRLRNALLPVVTVIGLSLGTLIGGAILTETIFNLTGVGKTVFDAIEGRDYTVVQGFTLVIAVAFVRRRPRRRRALRLSRSAGPGDAGMSDFGPNNTERARRLVAANDPTGIGAAIDVVAPVIPATHGMWGNAFRQLLRKRSAVVGLAMLLMLVVVAVAAPPDRPVRSRPGAARTARRETRDAPCIHLFNWCEDGDSQHLMGIDGNGRDQFSRVVFAARVSLLAGLSSVVIAVVAGTIIGVVSGYFGRWVDNVLMRVMDVLLAFPALLLAIFIVTVFGRGLINAVLAISLVSIPVYALRREIERAQREGGRLRQGRRACSA